MHHAPKARRWMEQYSIEPRWFYKKSIWYQLCWDTPCAGPCKLPPEKNLLLWSSLLRGRAPTRVQTLPPNASRYFHLFPIESIIAVISFILLVLHPLLMHFDSNSEGVAPGEQPGKPRSLAFLYNGSVRNLSWVGYKLLELSICDWYIRPSAISELVSVQIGLLKHFDWLNWISSAHVNKTSNYGNIHVLYI